MKSCFLNWLHTEKKGDDSYEVKEEFSFFSTVLGQIERAPKGFPTDKATLRVWNLKLSCKFDEPGVAHDYLWAQGKYSKFMSDLAFYDLCRANKISFIESAFAYLVVVFFARKAWKAHRRGHTPGVKFLKSLESEPLET